MGAVPKPPAPSASASVMPEDITGTYESSLYGTLVIASGSADATPGGGFTLSIGRVAYPGILRHWDKNTYQAVWNDPDDAPDLFTFTVEDDGSISGLKGDAMGVFKKVQ